MQWQWEEVQKLWFEKRKNMPSDEILVEFIRFFYLEEVSYDYVFRSDTYSLEDLRDVFEKNMDSDGNLPSFPYNQFQNQIKDEFENLDFSVTDLCDGVMQILSVSHSPPCFIWPSDLDKVMMLWIEKNELNKFYKQQYFRESVKKHINELITLTFTEAELHSLTALSILEESDVVKTRLPRSFEKIPAMVLQKTIDTKEKNIERALAWYKKICPPNNGVDYTRDKLWMEETLTLEVVNFLKGEKEFAIFDFEIIRLAAHKLGGDNFERYMIFLVKNELKKRVVRKQNQKLNKNNNNKTRSLASIRSKQEDHFRYLGKIIEYSSFMNPACQDLDDDFE